METLTSYVVYYTTKNTEAQKQAVQKFTRGACIVAEFYEDPATDRPILMQAVEAAKEAGAVLLVAPLAYKTSAAQSANRKAALTREANVKTRDLCVMYRAKGLSLTAIADKLNKAGFKTVHGKAYKPITVKRLIEQAASIATTAPKTPRNKKAAQQLGTA